MFLLFCKRPLGRGISLFMCLLVLTSSPFAGLHSPIFDVSQFLSVVNTFFHNVNCLKYPITRFYYHSTMFMFANTRFLY